jgi:protein CpxP
MQAWIKTFARRGAIAVMGLGLLGGVAAYAHGGPWGHHRGPLSDEDAAKMSAHMVERVGKRLDLDAAQKERLSKLAQVLHTQRKAAMGDKAPQEQLQTLVAGKQFDREAAQALVATRTEAIRQASPAVIAAAADFYDSLRPEQQTKVREFMQRGPGRHGHGRHMGWGMSEGPDGRDDGEHSPRG